MAKAPAKTAARPRRARAEVQREFEEIQREVEAARESPDAKADEVRRLKEEATRRAAESLTVEGVVQQISSLGLEISRALSEVSGKLIEEVERLATVREAVRIEEEELARLHKIDIAATSLDQLAIVRK
jgi:colicin import membrane protein